MALLSPAKTQQRGERNPAGVRLLGMAWMGLLSCVNAAPWPQPTAVVPAIPEAFLGEWNANLEQCGSPRSESRLVLEPHHVSFFSSKAEVLELQQENPRRIRLKFRFKTTPEAGKGREGGDPAAPTQQRRYLLSSDLQRLQDISQGEQGLTRKRCPSGNR